ncbi:bifunctional 3-phenylpropionate/cinnamic acid dioxygenase ferredoxin subunit [Saccharothrix hoggarensis]|uniref:Bifunctional 3-phenylpropionate/cinnamic acid dioxygenase ferredoxin subunit n=1 Tax=Saccharothrix hoggarensis TaxID=913853 RepID=A0ABW3QTZ3_9PSEU
MAESRTSGRVLVCRVEDLPDGEAVRVPAEEAGTEDAVAVFNDGGRLFALNDTCTHARASLSDGWVQDGHVECPLHGGAFCLRTGEAVGAPASADATTHGVEVHEGAIYLLPRP